MTTLENCRIAVIGLGYVGLPLAVEFSKKYPTVGYDVNSMRVDELIRREDSTRQVTADELASSRATFTSDRSSIRSCNVFIITVPTPIDANKKPDLTFLLGATSAIGEVLKYGDTVIYESTVYPGCTEEDCIPVLERVSGLKLNSGFYCGYSPERVSPGDPIHTLKTIVKITSGSTPEAADFVDQLYAGIITAGTYKAPSIKVAEAAKAIENAQRDVNISFVNELALIFDRMGIDTTDVLNAASTKWNFLKFKPGLVGGHCIGVDPYYLAHKSESLGYKPEVILSGRRVNDSMGVFVVNKVVKQMLSKDMPIKGSRALILGITFKENCPDIRNTRVIDIYNELKEFGADVDVYDPVANKREVYRQYRIELINQFIASDYQALILAVAHNEFKTIDYKLFKDNGAVIFDTKSIIDRELADIRL